MAKDIARYTDRQMMKDFDRMLDSFFGHADAQRGHQAGQGFLRGEGPGGGIQAGRAQCVRRGPRLHIVGRRADEEKGGRKYITRERRCESFERSFTLPEDADEQRLEASCRKGVLELVVPKKAKAEPRRIEVKVN